MRYKAARLFLDNIRNSLRGWSFRWAKEKTEETGWPVIGEYTTTIRKRPELGEANSHRIHNMRLAAEKINGLLIRKWEIFSMMRTIGEALPEEGFRTGPVLVNGKVLILPGGGLCQVSTTLFNAALLANMRILEKHNHSTDYWGEKRFIDLGRDATYVYLLKDLKFKSGEHAPVRLEMELIDNDTKLCCRVKSPMETMPEVRIESEILKEIPLPDKLRIGEGISRSGWGVLTRRFSRDRSGVEKVTYRKKERYRPVFIPEDGDD